MPMTTPHKDGHPAARAAAPLLALALGLASQAACADGPGAPEKPTPASTPSGLDTAGEFLVCEAAVGLNAAMARANPQAYGGLLMLMSPFIFGDGMARGNPVSSAGFGMLEATGVYDLTAYPHDYDRGRVFRDNVLALNLSFATLMVVGWLGEDTPAGQAAQHLNFTPLPQGGMRVGYRWRF